MRFSILSLNDVMEMIRLLQRDSITVSRIRVSKDLRNVWFPGGCNGGVLGVPVVVSGDLSSYSAVLISDHGPVYMGGAGPTATTIPQGNCTIHKNNPCLYHAQGMCFYPLVCPSREPLFQPDRQSYRKGRGPGRQD